MKYRLEHRNTNHPQTREWHSKNPFKENRPWEYERLADCRARAGVMGGSTHARAVEQKTGKVVATWRMRNGSVTKLNYGTFTEAEMAHIAYAARGVWQQIGCDILDAIGTDNGKGEQATINRATLIEVVLDCSRLEQELRRDKTTPAGLADRVETDLYSTKGVIAAYLRADVFLDSDYGF